MKTNIKSISGPVFLTRLENKFEKNNIVIYLFGDIHFDLYEQTQCKINDNMMFIQDYLKYLFDKNERTNKKIHFYLETSCFYKQYFDGKMSNDIYINQLRNLFHTSESNNSYKKTKFFDFDDRLDTSRSFGKLSLSSLKLSGINKTIIGFQLVVLLICIVFCIILMNDYKNKKKTGNINKSDYLAYFLSCLLLIPLIFTGIGNILLYSIEIHFFTKYKSQFLNEYSQDPFQKSILKSQKKEIIDEYYHLIDIIANSSDYDIIFTCCTFIIDLYAINKIVSKKNSCNKNFVYSGLLHSYHMMFFLINKLGFKLTHTTHSDKSLIKKDAGRYNILDLVTHEDSVLISYLYENRDQCIIIDSFPENLD